MRQDCRSIVSKVLRARKIPRLPRDDIKVIVGPRNGLNIRSTCGVSVDEAIRNGAGVGDDEMITICSNPTQNVLVISIPKESTATKTAKMKVFTINGKRECGRLGHRPDVCPRPGMKLCPISGIKNPINGHECTPQCSICGEVHSTADRMCKAKYKVPHIVKQRRWKARFRNFQEQTPSPSDSKAGAVEEGRLSHSISRTRSQPVMGRSTRSGSSSPVKRRSKSHSTSRSPSRSRSRSQNQHHSQQDIIEATSGGKKKGPRKINWRAIVTGTKADPAQGHHLSGQPRAAADPRLVARMENTEKESRELRKELAKA
ncbi:hypothetical protein HPB51_005404 [Rhipicephalus microplus]|uniref:Uncharacterized protein n=1 Tax=Rhipicephalus microplus TaxID=6941 RepID=A0A9J6DZE6_RHIMP|nr:hypothetical protein HPB51_005404 [Rhipicephalus microplus]